MTFVITAVNKNPKSDIGFTPLNYETVCEGKKPFECDICDYSCAKKSTKFIAKDQLSRNFSQKTNEWICLSCLSCPEIHET